MLTSRGLGRVLGDLAAMGFDAKWGVLGAADVGANHQRDRIWIRGEATNPNSIGLQKPTNECQLESQGSNQLQVEQSRDTKNVAYTSSQRGQAGSSDSQGRQEGQSNQSEYSSNNLAYTSDQRDVWREWELGFVEQEHDSGRSSINGRREWWAIEPDLGRVAHGIPARVDRLKAIGNAQVPFCAASAWRILK